MNWPPTVRSKNLTIGGQFFIENIVLDLKYKLLQREGIIMNDYKEAIKTDMLIAIFTNELRRYYIRNVWFAIGLKIVHTKKEKQEFCFSIRSNNMGLLQGVASL